MNNTRRDFMLGVVIFCALLFSMIVINKVVSHEHNDDCNHQTTEIETTTDTVTNETTVDKLDKFIPDIPSRNLLSAYFEDTQVRSEDTTGIIEVPAIKCATPQTSILHKSTYEPDTVVETEPIEPQEELPDIIELDVVLYNDYKATFNKHDGRKYLDDIASLVKEYAPDGMFISAACAMAYTEGGSGKEGVYVLTNNCFGITATPSWEGYVYSRSTGKVYKDYKTAIRYGADDLFRAYDSMENSVKDYCKLISSDYYKEALSSETPGDYFQSVLNKGYGEFYLYDTWMYLVNLYDLTIYDEVK